MATGSNRWGEARWRRRLRRLAAAWLLAAIASTAIPDLAWAAPPNRAEPARIQPPAAGRPRPTGGQPAASRDRVARSSVTVLVVHANHSGRIDARLSDPALQRQLATLGYNGAQVLSASESQLAPGQSTVVNAEGGRRIEVTLEDTDPAQSRVRVVVFKDSEKKLDTTVTVKAGRAFLVAGPKYQDGVLLFPITVQ